MNCLRIQLAKIMPYLRQFLRQVYPCPTLFTIALYRMQDLIKLRLLPSRLRVESLENSSLACAYCSLNSFRSFLQP
jgi:hypothetical protein